MENKATKYRCVASKKLQGFQHTSELWNHMQLIQKNAAGCPTSLKKKNGPKNPTRLSSQKRKIFKNAPKELEVLDVVDVVSSVVVGVAWVSRLKHATIMGTEGPPLRIPRFPPQNRRPY